MLTAETSTPEADHAMRHDVDSLFPRVLRERLVVARPFLLTALAAILVGGLVAAAIAHAPDRRLVWMTAYLVLIAGVAQAVLGLGQALLPERLPSVAWRLGEWALFNAGSALVIVGTLAGRTLAVVVGTALFVAALLLFLGGLNSAHGSWLARVYRVLLLLVCIGAVTGLVLSLLGA